MKGEGINNMPKLKEMRENEKTLQKNEENQKKIIGSNLEEKEREILSEIFRQKIGLKNFCREKKNIKQKCKKFWPR